MECKYCGELIRHPRATQVYCSQSCRQMAYHDRKFAQNKALQDTKSTQITLSLDKVKRLLIDAQYVADKLLSVSNEGNVIAEQIISFNLDDLT